MGVLHFWTKVFRQEKIFHTIFGTAYLLRLMTQCQLKPNHPVTSLAQTLDYIEVAQKRQPRERTLTLMFIAHKVGLHLETVAYTSAVCLQS